ncbi:RNA helicase, putative [Plasmodium knowlesi strain H]|uniref:RNA helicase, putative n=3 Tax=Plasmodium knowlesi TaxID=5850 RepID=A0A5K1UEJ0_PLAKH|nr:RNA helicase, putative [Plasmodium knowlesi strain H]OTN68710.1 putative RNA helicase [Plasmodium knowlesi]CAA9986125.1 RNA helicase, putative [Plasmodium knowlesi strain H]SBO25298.1 RNA helicase, putative [Plasmodium knowlesi strain H]SBO27621.1 RNA helicase, putative [Plasmodium knowlesi strain H]VVS75599.1 RNA helicase, putative [Plasmodium knowlesi strain H]|eukprot:XP_002257536.1 RNA helicase, putative [Plasmodium knowlesi strain H]
MIRGPNIRSLGGKGRGPGVCKMFKGMLMSRNRNSTAISGGGLQIEGQSREGTDKRDDHNEDKPEDPSRKDQKASRIHIRRTNFKGVNFKEGLQSASFLEFNFKTDVYLKLNEMKIVTPTQIQRNVIPLLLQGRGESTEGGAELVTCDQKVDVYREILKSRNHINGYLKESFNMRGDFYDVEKYESGDGGKEVGEKHFRGRQSPGRYAHERRLPTAVPSHREEANSGGEKRKCFNDVYVIVSPDNTGKTLSYFLPILNNFYMNNEKIMKSLSKFYHFLNKYNYKKFRNKVFRKREKLICANRRMDNFFFHIAYEKHRVRNRYIYIRKYKNYNVSRSYVKNKKNNELNCLKHKKNVFFPYAIILTNTREAAFELFSFLKNFDINIELLAGGYLYKRKSVKKFHVEMLSPSPDGEAPRMDYADQLYQSHDEDHLGGFTNMRSEFIKTNDFLKRISKNVKRSSKAINYNIDILVGTPDKIFEKIDNCRNKHLYNFKFLKYVVVEQAETMCNAFNEGKLQLVFNHIKNYTNMYYFRGGISAEDSNVGDYPSYVLKDDHPGDPHGDGHQGQKKHFDLENEEARRSTRRGGRKSSLIRQKIRGYMAQEEGNNEMSPDICEEGEVGHGADDGSYRTGAPKSSDGERETNESCAGSSINGENPSEEASPRSTERKITERNERNERAEVIRVLNSGGAENEKNTLSSNIPISIFVSATKTFCISEFLANNMRSKHIQEVIHLKSHDVSSEMKHIFINSKNKEKTALLLELLNSKDARSSVGVKGGMDKRHFLSRHVIFCNTRKSVQNVADLLTELKYKVSCIHNEMSYKERSQNYGNFKKNKTNILVCTNIFSRGIQFENCDIINYDISNNINDYIYKSSKVAHSNGSTYCGGSSNTLTSFFSKKNTSLVNNIIEKTVDKKQIIFQNLNKKVSKMLKLQNKYYDIVKKKKRYQKKGGRKALHISPRRNCLSKKNKILSKKLYFYNKMNEERKRLIKKGILKGHEKIPRFPNRKAEIYDSNEYNSVQRLDDGALQILAKKRKTKKNKNEDEAKYEEDTIVLDNMPTYEDEAKTKEKRHQKKTYF